MQEGSLPGLRPSPSGIFDCYRQVVTAVKSPIVYDCDLLILKCSVFLGFLVTTSQTSLRDHDNNS
jgi:hypothetical protein